MTQPAEAVDIYPSEVEKIKAVFGQLESMWKFKKVDDPAAAAAHFNQQAVNAMGEIGFEIEVEWFQAGKNPYSTDMYVPRINITGRTRKEEEVDHDRMKHDIVTGLADGQPGYIREDGSEHEDPIKKIIV